VESSPEEVDQSSHPAYLHLIGEIAKQAGVSMTIISAANSGAVSIGAVATGVPARPLDFLLFGSSITHSPSPLLHNTGFGACDGLSDKFRYSKLDTTDIAAVGAAVREANFGGGSVTIPHKERVQPFLDSQSDAAIAIGAVNTIVVRHPNSCSGRNKKHLHGDNTDWVAIRDLVRERMVASTNRNGKQVVLVVGAGGTALAACYASQKLPQPVELIVANRTFTKAEAVANKFGGRAVSIDLDPTHVPAIDVVICTVPASAKFKLPVHLLATKPIVLSAAYKPDVTTIIAQAQQAGCPYILGAQMLVEQGLKQFELWTQRKAPVAQMRMAVLGKLHDSTSVARHLDSYYVQHGAYGYTASQ